MSLRYITRKFSLLLFGICVISFSCAGVNAIHTVYAADKDKDKKGKEESTTSKSIASGDSAKGKDKKDKEEGTTKSIANGDNVKDKDKKGKEEGTTSKSIANGDNVEGKDKNDPSKKSLADGGEKDSLATGSNTKDKSDVGDRDGLIDVDPKQEDFDLPDADASQKNLSTGIDSFMTMLSVILRAAGAILGAYATGKLIMAFHNDNADAKNNAVIMLSMAIIMIIMPSIVDALDIKSFFQK